MTRPPTRPAAIALAAIGLLLGAACADYDRLLDLAFPPEIAGLPADGAWLSLPIGSWITEREVEASAVAACFSRHCDKPAAVTTYRVAGREAQLLDELIADPARLLRAARRPDPRSRLIRKATGKPMPPTTLSAHPVAEGGWRGLRIDLARKDGSRPVVGLLVSRPLGADREAVLVIAADGEAATRVLRSVLAARA